VGRGVKMAKKRVVFCGRHQDGLTPWLNTQRYWECMLPYLKKTLLRSIIPWGITIYTIWQYNCVIWKYTLATPLCSHHSAPGNFGKYTCAPWCTRCACLNSYYGVFCKIHHSTNGKHTKYMVHMVCFPITPWCKGSKGLLARRKRNMAAPEPPRL